MTTPAPHTDAAHTAHPAPRTYLIVFAWLTVMTAVEVAVAALPIVETVKIAILVTLAVIKAALVVLYYMHLRYDSFWYWIILLVPIGFVILLTRYLILR
jgi:caa(3)-type oxidase subunit IV